MMINGEEYGDGPPLTPAEIDERGEDLADDATFDPEGWRYYSDVYDAETIAWLRAYLLAHPEDDFVREKLEDFDRLTANRENPVRPLR